MNSTIQYQMRKSPKINATKFSKLSLSWLLKLFNEGRKKNLVIEDLYEISDRNKSKNLGDILEKHWNDELLKSKTNTNYEPSLTRVLLKTFYLTMIKQFCLLFVLQIVFSILEPYFLGKLVENYAEYQDGTSDNYLYVYVFAGLLFLNTFVMAFGANNYTKSTLLLGMKVRVACCSLIYRKMLRLKLSALSQTSNGQLTNLLSNDVNRFDMLFLYLYYLFTIPFQLVAILVYTWQHVQLASFAGLLILILLTIPVQGYIGKWSAKLRGKIAKLTDKRVVLMNEIISGIQVIKMYAWEIPFEKFVETARFNEIKKINASNYLKGGTASGINFTERITIFTITVTFTLLGNSLTSVKVYSMYQCFRVLQRAMSFYYPTAVLMTTETLVTLKRIQTFLQLEDKLTLDTPLDSNMRNDAEVGGISIENYTATWVKTKQVLNNITLKIKSGEICAIIGPVGSGKSSFLSGILSEINVNSGRICINGTVSYSSQEPWLFGSSVRNNILFGLPYDEAKYKQVITTCSLTEDFLQLPYGDDTLVGDKGRSLSGGQKARINLARAIYRDADIYLLDDPLSAVDANVGKHIFQECIEKYLSNKTRVLVTHQIQHLQNVNHIIVLKDGQIEAEGTYSELVSQNLEFTKYLSANNEIEEKNITENTKADVNLFESMGVFAENNKPQVKLEEIATNKLQMKLFYKYFNASGNIWNYLFLLTLIFLSQVFNGAADFWLAYWTNLEEVRTKNQLNQPVIVTLNYSVSNQVSYQIDDTILSTSSAIGVYGIILIFVVFFGFAKNFHLISLCMRASRNLHNMIFNVLCRAPMRFFDTNPVGRILNRFTKDMGAVDEILPKTFMNSTYVVSTLLGTGVLISIVNPYLLLPTFILFILIAKIQDIYMSTAQDIKRLEGITKSPIFSHTSATFEGLTTIRVCKAEENLLNEFDQHQDIHTSASYLNVVCSVCLGLCVDFLCGFYFISVTSCLILSSNRYHYTGSEIGMALSQSLRLLFVITFGIKEISEMINQMTCVERILQYTKIKSEGPFNTAKSEQNSNIWPNKGAIEFNKISMKYDEHEPNVLKNISLTINSGEKIGVVGRTGAGKSSLISSLFRLSIIDGDIIIDGINTRNIGLHDLRSKISIIPQQPVLFSATMRFNLDPFEQYEDHVLWNVLEEVKLKNVVSSLDFEIESGGTNFSIGQRQLICLARAILKRNKILILDEATANVDPHTDALIQQTIREKFISCTVITIAHRLNTIMDSDKVLVMDAGQMIEYDHPYELLQNKNGLFYKLYHESGIVINRDIFHDISNDP